MEHIVFTSVATARSSLCYATTTPVYSPAVLISFCAGSTNAIERSSDNPNGVVEDTLPIVARARAYLSLSDSIPGRAYYVRCIDTPSRGYYLVLFGFPGATVGVVTMDAATHVVSGSARLPGKCEQLQVTASEAKTVAGAKDDAIAELVWLPSIPSPFFPAWEVREAESDTIRYVDQQRRILTPADLRLSRAGG